MHNLTSTISRFIHSHIHGGYWGGGGLFSCKLANLLLLGVVVLIQKRLIFDNFVQDSTLIVLREESRVLSQSKSKVEQLLRSVKSNLQTLDNVRRSIRGKISSLSQALYLDAQSFKVYMYIRTTSQSLYTAVELRRPLYY